MKSLAIFLMILCRLLPTYGQDIFEAARKGNVARMAALVKIDPDTVNSRNESDFTPLIIAGYRGQLQAVEFLLNNKAIINASSPEGPVLLGACYHGNLELVEMLIAHGADVNITNETGTTALMYAALANKPELVKLLLKHGAKKTAKDVAGKTALSYAQRYESPELTALLSE